MEMYALVFRDVCCCLFLCHRCHGSCAILQVAPKRAALREAQIGLQEKQAALKKTQQQLAMVIQDVAKLQVIIVTSLMGFLSPPGLLRPSFGIETFVVLNVLVICLR